MVIQHPTSQSRRTEEHPNYLDMAVLHRCYQSRPSRLTSVSLASSCLQHAPWGHKCWGLPPAAATPPPLSLPRPAPRCTVVALASTQSARTSGFPALPHPSAYVCTLTQPLANVAVLCDFTGYVRLAKGQASPSSDTRLGAATVNPAICRRVHTPLVLDCTATLAPPCRPWSKR
eukprot:CAMPEP_0175835784 /NCGR_PEP_ID=MMETSP0107_2-20121207/16784_1 /TAXON_ID=195067 ORGANISM="Goniomonas pacifica, Strain CCMP1869" /NCGR_SAMPLE_ID=MMETSP0107_2 /ASSEMBLY_ACC=CAM_ASM_000203 /LENGTH=173 /DNA_ID=CAMNT_0017149115 /DNA_START=142 /DNA_END=659 /DNA_ORIENTATION=-